MRNQFFENSFARLSHPSRLSPFSSSMTASTSPFPPFADDIPVVEVRQTLGGM
jgi:hypothetical protein